MNDTHRKRFSWGWWVVVAAVLGIASWVLFHPRRGRVDWIPRNCINNMHVLGLAMLNYTNDWDDKFPVLLSTRQQVTKGKAWTDPLLQYMKDDSYLRCQKSSRDRLTYAFNRRLSGRSAAPWRVGRPTETIVIYESVNDRRENNNLNGATVWRPSDGGVPRVGSLVIWPDTEQYLHVAVDE